jgi:hypothetical protein
MWSHETDSQRRKIKVCSKLTRSLQKQLQKNPEHTASRRYHHSVRFRYAMYHTLLSPRILRHVALFHQEGISHYLHGTSCAKSLTILRGEKKLVYLYATGCGCGSQYLLCPLHPTISHVIYTQQNVHLYCTHFNYEDLICQYCGHYIRELHSVYSKPCVFKIYVGCNANRMFASVKVIFNILWLSLRFINIASV